MGPRLNSNALNLAIRNDIENYSNKIGKELQRISSGKRITMALDDPAGLAISTNIRAQVASYKQAQRNTGDALSLVQTSEGSLNEINNILLRMEELARAGLDKNMTKLDREILKIEYKELYNEVNRISYSTSYNGISLLRNNRKKLDFQVGINSGPNNVISLNLKSIRTSTRDLGIGDQGVGDDDDSCYSLDEIKCALLKISQQRAYLGSIQTRLSFANSHLDSMIIHHEDARSVIEDTDYAESVSNLIRAKISQNASIAALIQANSNRSLVLKLL